MNILQWVTEAKPRLNSTISDKGDMKKFDIDNQDLGAFLLVALAGMIIWQFQEINAVAQGLPQTILTSIVTAFIAWFNPKKN